MFWGRYFTEEEREKIKENQKKEREIKHYTYDAVQRMKSEDNGYRIKDYGDK